MPQHMTSLVRTAVKNANYTASVGDLVPVDTTSTNVTVTLPTAPANGNRVGVKHVILGAGHVVTVQCGGSDVFNKTGGSTSISLLVVNQAITVQYDSGIWSVVSDDVPLIAAEAGLLSAMPANGSRVEGSTYFATDQNGGTPYRMVAGVWVQEAAGVTQAAGQIIAGPAMLSTAFDVKAVGTTITDIPGMSISIPASSRAVMVKVRLTVGIDMGTAAVGSINGVWLLLRNAANTSLYLDTATKVSTGASTFSQSDKVFIEYYLPAPVSAQTLKLSTRVANALQSGISSMFLTPGLGLTGQSEAFYAETK